MTYTYSYDVIYYFKTHPSPGGYKGKCTQETLYVATQNDMLM